MLGTILELQGSKDEAKARYNKALQIDPRAAVAANNLAWIDANTNGNLDVALQLAQTAKAQLPNRHEVDDTLGWIYYKKGLSSLADRIAEPSAHAAARQPELQLSPRPGLSPERQHREGAQATWRRRSSSKATSKAPTRRASCWSRSKDDAPRRCHRLAGDLKEIVREQYEFRELLYQMTRRDLLLRYKQTVMGFGWAIFMPLVNTAVFSVIFTRVAPLDIGMPYPLFAYCGLLAWNFSASSFRFAVTSLTVERAASSPRCISRARSFRSRRCSCRSSISRSASIVLVGLMVYYQVVPTARAAGAAVGARRAHHVHAEHQPAAGDGQPVLSRREIPVRAGAHGVDVPERGALSGQPGRRLDGARDGDSTR